MTQIHSGASEEVKFGLDELFFSRTNEGGIIRSGNSVFQRVSGYSWSELIDKPHKIIRHPDMPRAVFWLLWNTIKRGEPIGAYVKNKAKDGRYYWVYAIVTPVEGGFLSVRLKPSSPFFSVIEQEYAALLAVEAGENLTPDESFTRLLERLNQLGFRDYKAFMSAALSKELSSRDIALSREHDADVAYFDELAESARSLLRQTESISEAYARNKYVPLNFQVQAAQLGQDGTAISVISNNYNIISAEIKSSLDKFIASAEQVLSVISDGQFLLCTAKVQKEVSDFFRREFPPPGTPRGKRKCRFSIASKAHICKRRSKACMPSQGRPRYSTAIAAK